MNNFKSASLLDQTLFTFWVGFFPMVSILSCFHALQTILVIPLRIALFFTERDAGSNSSPVLTSFTPVLSSSLIVILETIHYWEGTLVYKYPHPPPRFFPFSIISIPLCTVPSSIADEYSLLHQNFSSFLSYILHPTLHCAAGHRSQPIYLWMSSITRYSLAVLVVNICIFLLWRHHAGGVMQLPFLCNIIMPSVWHYLAACLTSSSPVAFRHLVSGELGQSICTFAFFVAFLPRFGYCWMLRYVLDGQPPTQVADQTILGVGDKIFWRGSFVTVMMRQLLAETIRVGSSGLCDMLFISSSNIGERWSSCPIIGRNHAACVLFLSIRPSLICQSRELYHPRLADAGSWTRAVAKVYFDKFVVRIYL